MDTTTTPTPGEQPSVTPAAETASEQLATQGDTHVEPPSLDSLDGSDLDAIIEEVARRDREQGPAQEAPQATTAQEETPPAAEPEPQPDPTEPQAPVKEGPLRRIPLGGVPEDQRKLIADATNLLRDGQAASLPEALAMLGHAPQAAPATETEAPQTQTQTPATQEPAPSSTVSGIKAKIAELREQRDAADEAFDKPEFRRLTNEIEDAQAELIRAEMAEREQGIQQRTWEQAHEAACDRVEAKYKQLEDPNSAFSQILTAKRIAAEATNDPITRDPAFIESMADEVAKMLGLNNPPPKAPQAKPSTPTGQVVAPGHQSAERINSAEAARMLQQASPDELDNLINEMERRRVSVTA